MALYWGITTLESFIGYVAILLDTSHWGTHFSRSWVDFLDDHYIEAYLSLMMMDFESQSFLGGYHIPFTLEYVAWMGYFI